MATFSFPTVNEVHMLFSEKGRGSAISSCRIYFPIQKTRILPYNGGMSDSELKWVLGIGFFLLGWYVAIINGWWGAGGMGRTTKPLIELGIFLLVMYIFGKGFKSDNSAYVRTKPQKPFPWF